MKITTMLPLLLVTAAFVTPASANWFHNPRLNINHHVGSAPNPTPADIRAMRQPTLAELEAAAAEAAKLAAAQSQPAAQTPSGGTTTVAAAAPAR